ncbi:MAG: hypothetical protein LDLANPLL_00243 [Turneriella sp.]|nr:hypothetical protein [Turneriella sp.]
MRSQVPLPLYIIHFVLMVTPAVIAFALYTFASSQPMPDAASSADSHVFQFTAAILAVIAVALSQLVPRFIIRNDAPLPLKRYTTMKIVQWALLEGAATFMGIIFFITQQKNMLIPLGILIALIALLRPTAEEMLRYKVKD